MSNVNDEQVEGKKGNWVTPKAPKLPDEPRNVPQSGLGETLPAEQEPADQSTQDESATSASEPDTAES